MSRIKLEVEMRSLLRGACEDLGIGDLCFCYDICSPSQWRSRLKGRQRHLKSFVKRRQLFASSEAALAFWRRKSTHLASEGIALHSLFSQKVYVWPEALLSPALKRQMHLQRVDTLVTLSIPSRESERFCGRFTLMLQGEEQVDWLRANLERVEQLLSRLLDQIVSAYGTRLNPLIDYNIVNPVSAVVLRGLAVGQGREQISQSLNLTPRGIDYHVGQLKQVLGAKTIAQMMVHATRYGLV